MQLDGVDLMICRIMNDSTDSASHWVVSSVLIWSYSPFCHYAPSLPSHNCPPLSFSLSLVHNYYFAVFFLSSGNLSFLVFFLSSSPSLSFIASHVLTSLAIYSPLPSSLFSSPRGLVQMSDQTEQRDSQRGAEFPLVRQSISNVPVCCV